MTVNITRKTSRRVLRPEQILARTSAAEIVIRPAWAGIPRAGTSNSSGTPLVQLELQERGMAEVIVVLDPKARFAPSSRGGARLESGGNAFGDLEAYFLKSGDSASLALSEAPSVPPVATFPLLGIMIGHVAADGLAALTADDRVDTVTSAAPLSLVRPHSVAAAETAETITWGMDRLSITKLWDQGFLGNGVLVGHIDTGVDGNHPALRDAIQHFTDIDLEGNERPTALAAHDTENHGTHTAGTIAGRTVDGRNIGIAPKAKLASAIVIEGGRVVRRVVRGLEWIVSKKARVVSISLGIRGSIPDFLPVIQALRDRDVLPVVAIGNEGRDTSRSPGNYVNVLSVGALEQGETVWADSSSMTFPRMDVQNVPRLIAPGTRVISARAGGGYSMKSGTSMATPHVAGLAALLMSARPEASIDDIERAILGSCHLGGLPALRAGAGVPDAVRALQLV